MIAVSYAVPFFVIIYPRWPVVISTAVTTISHTRIIQSGKIKIRADVGNYGVSGK